MRPFRLSVLSALVVLTTGYAALAQDPAPKAETERTDTNRESAPQARQQAEHPPPTDRDTTAKPPDTDTRARAESNPSSQQEKPERAETPAQSADTSSQQATTERTATLVAAEASLPPDSVTYHTLELPGRALKFEAIAGSLPMTSAEGRVQARMAYVSYTLTSSDSRARPVAFVFNGGPGSSSAWLHLGALGPWRLPLEGDSARPSSPGLSVSNADTWLDFADLVMVDPIGTGYSRFESTTAEETPDGAAAEVGSGRRAARKSGASRDLRKHYWSVSGDADSIAKFVSQWLTKTGRHASPKLLVGESYGGFRAPKIAHLLQTDYGVGVNLLVLVSPVLDYVFIRGHRHLPLNTVALLPSLSAAALEVRGKTPSAALMREAEEYARGEYLTDLMRGPRDTAAVGRVVKRVTALTDLPVEIVKRYGGRLDSYGYRREANEARGQIASAYDATIRGLSPDPHAPNARAHDPFVTALRAPLTTAALDLYAGKLDWRPEGRYLLMNSDVAGNWQYGNQPSPPEVVSDLKAILALDARLRVLVAHGYTDLVTPYFASTLVLDQLPAYGDARRVFQVNYPGGHMFYSRDGSRAAFREDVLIMLAASLTGEAPTR